MKVYSNGLESKIKDLEFQLKTTLQVNESLTLANEKLKNQLAQEPAPAKPKAHSDMGTSSLADITAHTAVLTATQSLQAAIQGLSSQLSSQSSQLSLQSQSISNLQMQINTLCAMKSNSPPQSCSHMQIRENHCSPATKEFRQSITTECQTEPQNTNITSLLIKRYFRGDWKVIGRAFSR